MHRFLLVVMALAAAQAREVESGLAALRHRLQSHSLAQRRLSPLQHRASLVSGTLAETAAALERSDGRDLAYLRERLLTASRSLEADFASIEAKLTTLGVPEKVDAWREFVRHYRARLAEVDGELASLATGAGNLSRGELRARLTALRAKLSSKDTSVHESVRGESPWRTLQRAASASADVLAPARAPSPQAEAHATTADDVPGPADLAESRVVLLTPEIRAKAAALGWSATALYNWVATSTEFVPYLGQMQNSQAVLLSGRGNDFDQATLLIALLRASGIPARYVCGDAAFTREEIRDWLGVKDESLMLGLLSRGLYFSLFRIETDRVIAVGHAWVEAYLDTGSGKRWMAMDPSRKRRSYQPGIVLPRPSYDRMAYLKALNPVPPSESYLDALRAELHRTQPGRGFNEVPYIGTLLPPPPAAPEPPYPVVKLQFRSPEIPTVLRHQLRVKLTDYVSTGNVHLSVDLSLPETLLQSLSLTFSTATAADAKVVEAFGGIEKTPAAVVNLIPELRLEGQVIASGKNRIPMATTLDLNITHVPAGGGTTQFVSRNMFTAGETVAVVIGANQISQELLSARIARFLERLPAANPGEATRRLLDVAGVRYLHRLEIDKQRVSDALQVRFIQASSVENAVTFASLEPQNLFDRPFVVTPGRLRIHANPTCLPLVDLNRSDQNDPVLKTAWQLHNDAASVLEHEVWEELALIPSASTIKILTTALRENIPIHIVNRANAATELPMIQGTASAKATMQQRIDAGATLTVPRRPVTIGSWQGQGWIEEYANWSYAYIIADASQTSPGGDTGGTPPPPRPPEEEGGGTGSTDEDNNTECADPVNISSGNLIEQVVDHVLAVPGAGIALLRAYNSLSLADGPLGPGWRHNFQTSLQDRGASVVVTTESGGVLTFRLVQGAYVSPSAYNLTLTKDAQGYRLRRRSGTELRFGLNGLLESITDRNQNALQLTYEAGRLRQVRGRAGRGITLVYDAKGRIIALEDFTGRRVGYEYDSAGHLAAVVDPAGNRTLYAYYTDRIFNRLLKGITTPEGRATTFQYYGNGKVASMTDPGGRSVAFLYLPLRNETHAIDEDGRAWSFHYNALGNVVRVIRPDGNYVESSYNSNGKLEAYTNAAGYTTRFTYDAAGDMTSTTDPAGRTVKFTYEPQFHQVASVEDVRGNITRYEYDSRGNLTRVVQPLGAETRLTRDERGNLTAMTDAEQNTVTMAYDQLGYLTEVRDALGNATKFEYDQLGRRTRSVDPLGAVTQQDYDALDRVVRMINQLGHEATATYDREGRLTAMTGFGGRVTRYSYDAMSNLSQVVDALGQTTRYVYSGPDCGCLATSNLAVFTDAAGFSRTQTYDFLNRLASATDLLGNTVRYAYDARGHLAQKTDANGNVTTFEFDAAGQLTRKLFSDGTDVRFIYDAAGNLVAAGNAYVWYTFTYDELNRLTSVTDSRFQNSVRYTYDRLGQRSAMTGPDGGITTYTYNANRRLTSVTTPSGATVRFTYDAYGRMTAITYPTGAAATLEYDAAGQLLGLVYAHAGSAGPWAALRYTYDKAGNRVSMTDQTGWHVYQYDEADRLLAAQHEAAPAETYTYDPAGNRTSAAGAAYQYDAAGRHIAAEATQFTYDKNGNLTARSYSNGTTRYTWDIENRLVRVDLPDGGVITYRYDPFGRRIEKNVNGAVTVYFYDGGNILLEMDAEGQTKARHTHGPGIDWPLALERDGQTWFHHTDALGSVIALSDSSGNLAAQYTYDVWGRPAIRGAEGAPPNPYLFTGREFDPETSFYHMRARYYDAASGRFISADPLDLPGLLVTRQSVSHEEALLPRAAAWALRGGRLGLMGLLGAAAQRWPQGLNAYAYAGNNPLRYRDPSGLMICKFLKNPLTEALQKMNAEVQQMLQTMGEGGAWILAGSVQIPPELQGMMFQANQTGQQFGGDLLQVVQQIQQSQAQGAMTQIESGLLDPQGGMVTLEDYLNSQLTGQAASLQDQVSNLTTVYQNLTNMMKSIADMQKAVIKNIAQ